MGATIIEEAGVEKLKYPKSVFFIITNELCERFSYYGLRTILVLYLNYQLGYSKDSATVVYHVFIMFAYFFPVLGAIIADSWLGKYKTILYLSIVYAIGNIVVAITAVTPLELPQSALTILGLLLISFGTGGIKPCVSSFGGDQFVVPEQEVQLQKFFSVFYFAINAGSFISTFVTPILREDVHCFGDDSCFSLAFGVPAGLMVVSIVAFVLGSRWYKIKPPEGNIVVEVSKCIWYACRKPSKGIKRDHWLDKADDKFDKQFIEDVKVTLKVLVLYIPLPIFWALFDQQGSRWTFQAARMDGKLSDSFNLKPDQMQVLNPILILAFIPLFETVVYPILLKFGLLKKPLQKLVIGGLLAGVAFIMSAGVEFVLEKTYPILPIEGEGQLRLYNVLDCDIDLKFQQQSFILKQQEMWEQNNISLPNGNEQFDIEWGCNGKTKTTIKVEVVDNEATSYTFYNNEKLFKSSNENLDKSDNGDPMVMVIYNVIGKSSDKWERNVTFVDGDEVEYTALVNSSTIGLQYSKVSAGKYKVKVNNMVTEEEFDLKQGGGYVFLGEEMDDNKLLVKMIQVTEPNSVNMLWLVPQYVTITAGEIMFSIPGLEFSFTQAPTSMKSVMTSMWLLAVAFGNLIVIIVAEAKFFDSQAYEFLLFAGLMILDMVIFVFMARNYKYVEYKPKEEEPNGNEIELKEKEAKD